MKRPKFIFVGGINGSGKTTILNLVAASNKEVSVIKGSKIFMKWLGIKRGNYKKLQSLPDKKVLMEQEKMIHYLVKKRRFGRSKKIVLIDAHYVNIREERVQGWVGDWLSMMSGLALIKASPTDILRRIEYDENESIRKRSVFAIHTNNKHKLKLVGVFNRKSDRVFRKFARMYNKPNKVFINKKGQSGRVAKRLNEFLASI
ncbi:MAG: AAA family ATPase [Patescibacteria group bacterium]